MKKILLLLPLIMLAACDNKKTSDADLQCYMFADWQTPRVSALSEQEYHAKRRAETKLDVNIQTFEDHAIVTANGESAVFVKLSEQREGGVFGRVWITFGGDFPGTEREARLSVYGDISGKLILQYDISFTDEHFIFAATGKEMGIGIPCRPVKQEYLDQEWAAKVPFNHNYKMPNKTERCINEIISKISCETMRCKELAIYLPSAEQRFVKLSREEAMSISANWDYSNMKLYSNDGVVQEHEKDACETLKRLNKFIKDRNLDASQS